MKEYQIRPKDLYLEYIGLIKEDAKMLAGRGVMVPCPGCGNKDTHRLFEKNGFPYDHCGKCNTFFCNPRPTLKDMEFFYKDTESARYWNEKFWPIVEETRRADIFAPRVKKIRGYCETHGIRLNRILDIGAGNGIFLEEFRNQVPEAEFRAIDPGSKAVEKCREKGFEVYETTVELAKQWKGWADVVVSFEVLEHAHDPLLFVRSAMRFLAPGGAVLMTTLNHEGADLRLLRDRSGQVLPPLHINFLSVTGFRNLFARAGFSKIETRTPGRLDVDILTNALEEGLLGREELDPFLDWLIYEADGNIRENFQCFLADSGMSSHIWIWARK